MVNVDYTELSKEMLTQLEKGIFMTVKNGDKINTMTIGWGSLGFMWGKPVFTALVRYSRHTYDMLKNTDEYTISVPLKKDLKKELMFCGTKSGRDFDKIKECGLVLLDGQKVDTPIIGDCELHFECKVVYKQDMVNGDLDEEIKTSKYENGDYHVMYFGEIVASYLNKK